METLSQRKFIATLPDVVIPRLPDRFQGIQERQPWRWIIQFHFGEPRLHYEMSRAARQKGWELGFHFEARDKNLNRFLLNGFRRNLLKLKTRSGNP